MWIRAIHLKCIKNSTRFSLRRAQITMQIGTFETKCICGIYYMYVLCRWQSSFYMLGSHIQSCIFQPKSFCRVLLEEQETKTKQMLHADAKISFLICLTKEWYNFDRSIYGRFCFKNFALSKAVFNAIFKSYLSQKSSSRV